MSTSATLPSTIQIRPSRLAGLLVAVVILTSATTWSVNQVTTESDARSTLQSEPRRTLDTPTSQRPAPVLPPAYVDSVVALDAEQRAAIFGNLYPTQQYVQGVIALTPDQQAAIWGNVSSTHQYVNGVTALAPERQAAIYGNVYAIR